MSSLRLHPTLMGALQALLLLLCTGGAKAQPFGETSVVPVIIGEQTSAVRAAGLVDGELSRSQAQAVSLHESRDRLHARSRPAQLATVGDVDLLARAAREAVEHVAFGRTAAAHESVREVITRAERTLESLNRETKTARAILDTCLTLVRSALQSGKRELALEQAMRCRRLVPDLSPSEATHPVNVVGVLAEADNLQRRLRTGRLQVRSTPESSCPVYLNGRHLGTTPFQLDRAAAGEYRVQVECGRNTGRVHLVQLGDEPADLLVDEAFDRALRDEPRVTLHYDDLTEAHARAVGHAIQLGRELAVDDVVLVAVRGDGAELLRVRVQQGRLVGRARLEWSDARGVAPGKLEAAVLTLAEARLDGTSRFQPDGAAQPGAGSVERASRAHGVRTPAEPSESAPPLEAAAAPEQPAPEPVSRGPSVTADEPRVEELSTPRKRTGYALLGSAVALIAVGGSLELRSQNLYDELGDYAVAIDSDALNPTPAQEKALDTRHAQWELATGMRWIGLAGGAAALASSILLVRARPQVPWWSYGLGALGAALAAGGVHQIAVSSDCLRDSSKAGQPCRRPRDSAMRGALMLSTAASLIAVPVTHLVRRQPSSDVAVLPAMGARALGLTVSLRL